ncbi:MAG: SRPBCC family protein [Ilumatobacteraceae bacterium]
MTSSPAEPDGVLEHTDTGAVLRFERHLHHPVEAVWAAVTEPSRLAEWWLPFPADITVDLRPGGRMVMTANGDEPFTMDFEVLRVEPPLLLEHTHADPGSRLLWELDPVDDGCILRLSHFVTDPAVAIERCYLVGLHASLERLNPCLDGAPIEWDWEGFARHQARYAAAGLAPEEPH